MTTKPFNYTGAAQAFVVPPQCTTVHFDLAGAGGGASTGGNGGRVTGDLAVTPGETLWIYVGGTGGVGDDSTGVGGPGGWNGGGAGGNSTGTGGYVGFGGGGACDIRQGGQALANRKAVAAGGGGSGRAVTNGGGAQGGTNNNTVVGNGVSGGIFTGGHCATTAAGGVRGQAGTGASDTAADGALGVGGHGSLHSGANLRAGGGGGGGYYGGGGGGGATDQSGGGGGGSNYIGGSGVSGATSVQGTGQIAGQNATAVLTYNVAPNAPTLTKPVNNGSVLNTADVNFDWDFSDDDPSDAQTKFDLRYRIGSGAWTTVTQTTATTAYTLTNAASGFSAYAGQQIEWQVRTYDSKNAVSSWSTSSFFTLRTIPTAPTWNPVPTINTQTPILHVNTPDGAVSNHVKIYADSGGALGALLYEKMTTVSGTPPTTEAISVTGGPTFVNGTAYHFVFSYARYSNGAAIADQPWSAEIDSGAVTANINAPLTPLVALSPSDATASVLVQITNPGSDPNPPAYNDVYRQNQDDDSDEVCIATNVALNGSFIDYTPANRTTYRYRVVAVRTANNSTASSA